jgi:hypothetical protein
MGTNRGTIMGAARPKRKARMTPLVGLAVVLLATLSSTVAITAAQQPVSEPPKADK